MAIPPPSKGGRYRWLNILPDGGGALVVEQPGSGGDNAQYKLHVVDLKSGRISTTLQGVAGSYVAEAGALVYVAPEGTLLAMPFDLGKLSVRGRPVPLFGNLSVRGVQTDLALAGGTLAYTLPGLNSAETLVWVDRSGGMTPVDTAWHDPELEAYALSPDGPGSPSASFRRCRGLVRRGQRATVELMSASSRWTAGPCRG